jgi:hypothetical protein
MMLSFLGLNRSINFGPARANHQVLSLFHAEAFSLADVVRRGRTAMNASVSINFDLCAIRFHDDIAEIPAEINFSCFVTTFSHDLSVSLQVVAVLAGKFCSGVDAMRQKPVDVLFRLTFPESNFGGFREGPPYIDDTQLAYIARA